MKPTIEPRDLITLSRLTKELVRLHVKYIKRHFTPLEIGQTFSQLYFKQLEQALDQDAIELLNKQNSNYQRFKPLSAFDLCGNVCLRLSTAFIKTVGIMLDEK